MELFRSVEMRYVRLLIPVEAARASVLNVGALECLQFTDLNAGVSVIHRQYAADVRRCDDMLRTLSYLAEQIRRDGKLAALPSSASSGNASSRSAVMSDSVMAALASELAVREVELRELTSNLEELRKREAELVEFQIVIELAGTFFSASAAPARGTEELNATSHSAASGYTADAPLLVGGSSGSGRSSPDSDAADVEMTDVGARATARLGFVAGVVATDRIAGFERVLFRATRGNVFLKQAPIDGPIADPSSGERVLKTVFVVFFAGVTAREKVQKICEAYGANRYPLPDDVAEQRHVHAELTTRLRELHVTLTASDRQRGEALASLAIRTPEWTEAVHREKTAYHVLNMCTLQGHFLQAKAWCPAKSLPRVQEAASSLAYSAGTVLRTIVEVVEYRDDPIERLRGPPTHFNTNDMTSCFQEIVNAYGIARYREVNPTVFTIITFPFLFAVMFGDVGHGCILLTAAIYLIARETTLKRRVLGEMEGMLFAGRYCLLLCALFSIYMGFLYNEFFSVPMTLFGTTRFVCPTSDMHMLEAMHGNMSYTEAANDHTCPSATTTGLILPKGSAPYPVGLDPVWHDATTELGYTNSLKMKMSIVVGVVQMTLGIIMSYLNFRHEKDTLSMYCEFVPQMLFLMSMFGYLSVLILAKWSSGSIADLYHILIYMFLDIGNVACKDPVTKEETCKENRMFAGQGGFQTLLVLIMVVCVPWMLAVKPYILNKRHQARRRAELYSRLSDDEGDEDAGDENFDFTEILVHQIIHTIEFVLGVISNTASYLRLWALSLAHSQLSTVFYNLILMSGVQLGNPVILFVGVAIWSFATFAVLIVMEGLSAFLHALRLHWVEFQNKFYRSDGWKFEPHFSAENANAVRA